MTLSIAKKKNRHLVFSAIIEIKRLFGCFICGINDPKILTFHHTNCRTKTSTIHELVHRGKSERIIENEMKKCAILCEKCHKEVHNGR